MDTTSRRRTGRAATAATETAYVVAATELDTTARRRSGRASTQLATKVSAILAGMYIHFENPNTVQVCLC